MAGNGKQAGRQAVTGRPYSRRPDACRQAGSSRLAGRRSHTRITLQAGSSRQAMHTSHSSESGSSRQ